MGVYHEYSCLWMSDRDGTWEDFLMCLIEKYRGSGCTRWNHLKTDISKIVTPRERGPASLTDPQSGAGALILVLCTNFLTFL